MMRWIELAVAIAVWIVLPIAWVIVAVLMIRAVL
jgi:hypothetical protein